ncbi:type II toxin-antitoxin system HicA family toxin [Methylocucumis oryzae]
MKVSEILGLLAKDDWYLVATRGSHRQFRHPTKSGREPFLESQAMI